MSDKYFGPQYFAVWASLYSFVGAIPISEIPSYIQERRQRDLSYFLVGFVLFFSFFFWDSFSWFCCVLDIQKCSIFCVLGVRTNTNCTTFSKWCNRNSISLKSIGTSPIILQKRTHLLVLKIHSWAYLREFVYHTNSLIPTFWAFYNAFKNNNDNPSVLYWSDMLFFLNCPKINKNKTKL